LLQVWRGGGWEGEMVEQSNRFARLKIFLKINKEKRDNCKKKKQSVYCWFIYILNTFSQIQMNLHNQGMEKSIIGYQYLKFY
jgi:hypothetical protein